MVNEELRRGHDARPSASGSRGGWGLPPTTADVVNHVMVEVGSTEGPRMPASDEHLTRRLPMNDEYLAQRLTPYPLPTKDSGLLRTVGDARTYMLTLPKARKLRTHWRHTSRLLLQEAGAAALTRQVHLALFMDGKLDVAPHHTSSSRRWRRHTPS
jgi:hypothetical protein